MNKRHRVIFAVHLGFGGREQFDGTVAGEAGIEFVDGVEGFAFIRFTHRDVVRHPLVQDVVDRYARWEQKTRTRDDGQ